MTPLGKIDDEALADSEFDAVFAAAALLGDGSPLLLAVSGGSDSTALVQAAASWSRRQCGPPLFAATVDHGLRAEARAEAEAVGLAAAALDLPHAILTWEPPSQRASQAAAREARYRLLLAHAAAVGATRLVTAHTLDDQAETILMRLADGSGLTGLAGMAPATRRGDILHHRPFLRLRKAALVATCEARGWVYAVDPLNADPRFARPRWRALAGALSAEGLTPERLARLADRLRRADSALEALADRVAVEVITSGRLPRPASACSHPSLEGRTEAPTRGDPPLGHPRHRARGAVGSPHLAGFAVDPPLSGKDVGPLRPMLVDFTRLAREPDEIALRVLVRALCRVVPNPRHLRLERVESALASLQAAHRAGMRRKRSLAGCILALDPAGTLVLSPEPPRRRGR